MMQQLRSDAYDRPANWISNLLCFGYGECRPPRSGGEGEGVPKSMQVPASAQAMETPALSAYPNPAGAWANLVYELKTAPDNAYIGIRDAAGKEVARIPVDRGNGQTVWDTRQVAAGTYTAELINDGSTVGTVKIIVKQ